MISLTFLYDEYIDRRKSSEQKNPFEYIVRVGKEQSEKLRMRNVLEDQSLILEASMIAGVRTKNQSRSNFL